MARCHVPSREECLVVLKQDGLLLDEIQEYYFNNEVTSDDIRSKFGVSKEKLNKLHLRSSKAAYWAERVSDLYGTGLTTQQMADTLGISFYAVEAYITRLGLRKAKDEAQKTSKLETESTIWKPLQFPGVKDYYLVGNKNGEIINTSTNTLMSASINKKDGYLYTMLSRSKPHTYASSGKVTHSIQIATHRLVALTYCDHNGNKAGTKEFYRYIKTNDLTVNHKLGIKHDNSVDQLEWLTNAENVKHSHVTGLKQTKLNEAIVRQICKSINKGLSNVDIAAKFDNVNRDDVRKIRIGETWSRISSEYGITIDKSVQLRTEPLTDDEVREICQYILDGLDNKTIAANYNVDSRRVIDIRNMKRRAGISCEFFTTIIPFKK